MKRILITGVSGFVGSNLASHFRRQDQFKVFGHSRHPEKLKNFAEKLEVTFIETLSATQLDAFQIDTVIHTAGIAHDLSGNYRPEDYFRVNFEGTQFIYNEFLKSKAEKFFFISSVKAVADVSVEPLEESVQVQPVTDYGKSKLKAEAYIQSMRLGEGKRFYIFRPCMIHGPGNKGNLNLLYRYVKTGLPFPLGAFHNQRSFLSIDNFSFVVEEFIRDDIGSGIFHVADEGFLSTTELYQLIVSALSKQPRVWNLPEGWIKLMSKITGQSKSLQKLTEDFVVSNKKLLISIQKPLPVSIKEGLLKTIRSFHE